MTMDFTLARQQAKFGKMDILSVDYRLAPGSKYPTQLFEAFSAWKYLREMGYQTICLGGDSAGANLALLLWQYLDEVEKDAAAVAGLVLHSVSIEIYIIW
jgi:acetyl esterase/lipase